jgi:hypothetical protein
MPNAMQLDCSPEAYHEIDAVSQSRLKIFLKDPDLYRQLFVDKTRAPKPTTKAQQEGKDIEKMVLYGQLADDDVEIIPADKLSASGDRRGKTYTDWAAAKLAEKPNCRLLKQQEFDDQFGKLIEIQTAVYAHPRAARLLDGATRHRAIIWEDSETGLPCKAQLDLDKRVGDKAVVGDLKTCKSSEPAQFAKAVLEYGYHLQAWMYRQAYYELTGIDPFFAYIAAEKEPSYCVEVFDLSPEWWVYAEPVMRAGMRALARAYESGEWRRPSWGAVETLKPPPWAQRATEDRVWMWAEE